MQKEKDVSEEEKRNEQVEEQNGDLDEPQI